MKRLSAVIGLLGLAACDRLGPREVEYRLAAYGTEVASATLTVCDQAHEMRRVGSAWEAEVPLTCEGGGLILVSLVDGASITCSGDRIAPDMQEPSIGYVVSSTGCALAQ